MDIIIRIYQQTSKTAGEYFIQDDLIQCILLLSCEMLK